METIDRAKELAQQTGRPWDEMGAYEREMFLDEARKAESHLDIVASNKKPKQYIPWCRECGWKMGGVDSWNGRTCKCGFSHAPVDLVE